MMRFDVEFGGGFLLGLMFGVVLTILIGQWLQ